MTLPQKTSDLDEAVSSTLSDTGMMFPMEMSSPKESIIAPPLPTTTPAIASGGHAGVPCRVDILLAWRLANPLRNPSLALDKHRTEVALGDQPLKEDEQAVDETLTQARQKRKYSVGFLENNKEPTVTLVALTETVSHAEGSLLNDFEKEPVVLSLSPSLLTAARPVSAPGRSSLENNARSPLSDDGTRRSSSAPLLDSNNEYLTWRSVSRARGNAFSGPRTGL